LVEFVQIISVVQPSTARENCPGRINKLTYSKPGTNGGTRFVLAGMTEEGKSYYISSDDEVAAPTTAVASGGSAVAAPTTAVVQPTAAVVAPTAAVVQPGLVRARVAALQSAALGLVAMAAQPPLPPLPRPPVAVREEETQTDPMEFPFVYPVREGDKWWI
jgi:hypothetical protein